MKVFKTNQNTPERVLRFILAIVLIPVPFAPEQTNYTYYNLCFGCYSVNQRTFWNMLHL